MILTVQGVHFQYPGRSVLEDVSFDVKKGELLAILGTNGTGKTTLLKCINRILKPVSGSVMIDNLDVKTLNRKELARLTGYVEQQHTGSCATVFNTVLLGRKPYIEWDITQKDIHIANQALESLGLADYALRHLNQLSGGELQKVIIARALAQEPQLLLMDEPTSNLDLKNQLEVLTLIRKITRDRGITTVIAMHDLNLSLRFSDKFVLLKDKKIFAAGGEEIMTPENIESVYAVPVVISSYNGHRFIVPL